MQETGTTPQPFHLSVSGLQDADVTPVKDSTIQGQSHILDPSKSSETGMQDINNLLTA